MMTAPGEGYIPAYTRTDLTDALHDAFGFRTDYQFTFQKNMRKILNQTKKKQKQLHTFQPRKPHKQRIYAGCEVFTFSQLSKMGYYLNDCIFHTTDCLISY